MAAKRLDEAAFSKFFSGVAERFGGAVGVEERVSWEELAFFERAIPFLKQSEHSGPGRESLQSAETTLTEPAISNSCAARRCFSTPAVNFIEAGKDKGVSVHIFKRVKVPPIRGCRC